MKLSDWKSRVQAMFRPAREHTALAPNVAPKPIEIVIPSNGERFVHSSPLEDSAESRDMKPDPQFDELVLLNVADRLRWDGKSVRDIDTKPFYDYPELETHSILQASVPLNARPEFWKAAPNEPAYRFSITVLAVDKSGEALVKEYVADHRRNADGWSYSVMSTDRAAERLREYGAAADLNLDGKQGLESTIERLQAPNSGGTYRGEILSIKGDTLYQRVAQETAIEHRVGALAIADPGQFVGKEVEISYPCGQIGLVRPIDGMALTTPNLQISVGEKATDGLER